MKKTLPLLFCLLLVIAIVFSGCNHEKNETESLQRCTYCRDKIPNDAKYCPYCGKILDESQQSHSEAILGTWETYDDSWGRFTYTFYRDGSCVGTYHGKSNGTKVGNVLPSLYLDSYYIGACDGVWSFEEGKLSSLLIVNYRGDRYGDHAGMQQYEYSFNEDYTALTIYGTATYGNRAHSSIVWTKLVQ